MTPSRACKTVQKITRMSAERGLKQNGLVRRARFSKNSANSFEPGKYFQVGFLAIGSSFSTN